MIDKKEQKLAPALVVLILSLTVVPLEISILWNGIISEIFGFQMLGYWEVIGIISFLALLKIDFKGLKDDSRIYSWYSIISVSLAMFFVFVLGLLAMFFIS